MMQQWFVRTGFEEYGPITFGPLAQLAATGKLADSDFVRSADETDRHRGGSAIDGCYPVFKASDTATWTRAGDIKGLFDKNTVPRFAFASQRMKHGSSTSLLKAAFTLTETIDDPGSSILSRLDAQWMRGECKQRMARNANALEEALSLYTSALRDHVMSVKTQPDIFAHRMADNVWWPENAVFIPAYLALISGAKNLHLGHHRLLRAIGKMGAEATEVLPILMELSPRHTDKYDMVGYSIRDAIERISTPHQRQTPDKMLLLRVEDQLRNYPTRQDRLYEIFHDHLITYADDIDGDLFHILDEHDLTAEEVSRSQSELVALLADNNWIVRVKSACILRCKVDEPSAETIRTLFDHLGPGENQSNVRGECVLTLGHFAATGLLVTETFDHIVNALRDRLAHDSAQSVRIVAAEVLARIGKYLPDVITSLIAALTSALSKPETLELQTAFVAALGDCGRSAESSLPLVLRVRPFNADQSDDKTAQVVKAMTILQIAPADHPEKQTSLKTLDANLRSQPNYLRQEALKAVCSVPMDESFRKKLLLERLFFDDSARLRCDAARALIAIDKDLATKAGAYLVVDRIGCS